MPNRENGGFMMFFNMSQKEIESLLKEAVYQIPWPDPVFQLDEYFNHCAEYYHEIIENGGREFPEFPRLLKHYQRVIKSSAHMIDTTSTGPAYVQQPMFPLPTAETPNYYAVAWSVPKLQEIQKQKKKKPVPIPVKELWEQCGKKDEINREYARSLKPPFDPILAVAYPPSKSIIVVDGAHRLANLYERGEENVETYLFEPDEHMEAMVGELSRNLYKIHHNIVAVLNYCVGLSDKVIPYWKADIEELGLEDRRWRYVFNIQPMTQMEINIVKIGSGQWVFYYPYDTASPIIEHDAENGINQLIQRTKDLFPSIEKLHLQCEQKDHPFPKTLSI